MSDASPSPIPEAAARSRTPPRALVLCVVSQPASAMYLSASALSLALKTVVAPYSLAVCSRSSNCSPVAPLRACTSDIVASNSAPSCIVSLTKLLTADAAAVIACEARFARVALKTVNPSLACAAASFASLRLPLSSSDAFSACPALRPASPYSSESRSAA